MSRTLSQTHALLMVSPEPLNTDQIMAGLGVSRGGAHASLRELSDWGLVRRICLPGDRKDYYEAGKDVWRVVQLIARQRRRKEVEPVLDALDECLAGTQGIRGAEARAFRAQLTELRRFARIGDRVLERVGRQRSVSLLGWVTRFLK